MFKVDCQKNNPNSINMRDTREWKNKIQLREEKNKLLLKMWKKNRKMKTGVELQNKIGQQKSKCLVCDSKKSSFLKPIKQITNKK